MHIKKQNNATQSGSTKNWQKVVVTIALLYYSNIADYQNPQQIYCSEVGSFLLMFKGKRVPWSNTLCIIYDLTLIANGIQFSEESDL